jgi:RecG-like helicase
VEPGFRGRTQRTIARLEDDTGTIDATWFGRRFIERRLPIGAEIVVSGKIKHFGRRLTLDNPEFQVVVDETELLHAGRIVPVYPLTAGLTSIRLRAAIREALDKAGYAYPEYSRAIMPRKGSCRLQRDRGGPLPRSVERRDAATPARVR